MSRALAAASFAAAATAKAHAVTTGKPFIGCIATTATRAIRTA